MLFRFRFFSAGFPRNLGFTGAALGITGKTAPPAGFSTCDGKAARVIKLVLLLLLFPLGFAGSQSAGTGVSAGAAERYLRWAEQAIGEGRWDEALGVLERGADFADVSSDISYLLALVRYQNDRSLYVVLDSLRRAFETDRWESYSPAQGRFLEAEALICLRMFSQALRVLALAEQDPDPGIGAGGRRGGYPPAEGGGGEPEVRSQGGDFPPHDGLAGYPDRDPRAVFPLPRPAESDALVLRLLALKGLGETEDLLRALGGAMERYPRDPRPVAILLAWARDRMPESSPGLRLVVGDGEGEDRALVDRALRRLPPILEGWGSEGGALYPFGPRFRGNFTPLRLACLAAPFIRDRAEARRLVSACRALGGPERESIPLSLDLGIIDEGQAMEELFAPGDGPGALILDRDLVRRVWSLLRDRESRAAFRRRLLRFSGILTTDADGDGIWEESSRYVEGTVRDYYRDADQDGPEDLRVSFSSGGIPREAWLSPGGMPEGAPEAVRGDARDDTWSGAGDAASRFPGGRIYLRWERYPAVLDAELDGVVYVPAPETFFYAPIRFTPLPGDDTGIEGEPGLLYPEAELPQIRLTGRTLVSFALSVIRPSLEFPGGLERITMERSVPRRAVETLDGRVVAVTEFVRGQPRIQRVDLDLDGRMETIRRFREGVPGEDPLAYERIPELVETDRDRDGLYEMGEQFFPDGTSIYSWDTDGDGIRDFFETWTGK